MSKQQTTLFDKIFRNKTGKIVIFQVPNVPLAVWLACAVLQRFATEGKAHTGLQLLGQAALATWAYLEIRNGDNLFRRIFGGIVMIALLISFFR